MTEPFGQFKQDIHIITGTKWGLLGFANPLDPPLAVGDSPFGLAPPRSGRKHHIGHFTGWSQINILDDQELERFQEPFGAGSVRLGL